MNLFVECYVKTAAAADKYVNMFQLSATLEKNIEEKNRQQ